MITKVWPPSNLFRLIVLLHLSKCTQDKWEDSALLLATDHQHNIVTRNETGCKKKIHFKIYFDHIGTSINKIFKIIVSSLLHIPLINTGWFRIKKKKTKFKVKFFCTPFYNRVEKNKVGNILMQEMKVLKWEPSSPVTIVRGGRYWVV